MYLQVSVDIIMGTWQKRRDIDILSCRHRFGSSYMRADIKDIVTTAAQRGRPSLSEHVSKLILADYGVPVIDEVLVQSADIAVDAAEKIGYPIVIKACGPGLVHKSDRGLVALNLPNALAVTAAFKDIQKRLDGTEIEGVLVQPMLRGKREIIVGALRDPSFGPSVMLGLGGILVEALADVAFRLAPLDMRDAVEMQQELRGHAIFGPLRGEPPADQNAVAAILIAAGRILIEHPEISHVDINPLIFTSANPVAADALISLVEEGGAA